MLWLKGSLMMSPAPVVLWAESIPLPLLGCAMQEVLANLGTDGFQYIQAEHLDTRLDRLIFLSSVAFFCLLLFENQ